VRFDREYITARAAALETAPPQEIVRFALTEYAPRVAISSAFGVEGCALIHMALQIDPRVAVFTVDTDYLFPETRALIQRFVERYDLNLVTYKSRLSVDEQTAHYGPALHARDPDQCCYLRKVEPTRRALADLECWLAALRRDQSDSRAGIPVVDLVVHDDGSPLVKVHPLARWTRRQVWQYVLDHEVPYNPLLDQGYTSIGCQPCTRAVAPGGGERAGRWDGARTECGIHTIAIRRDR
jgi:phosphoadenosine phosphosulfate reductase